MHPSQRIGYTVQAFRNIKPATIVSALRMLGVRFVEVDRSIFQQTSTFIKKIKPIRIGFHLPIIHDDGWDFSCANRPEITTLINDLNQHRKKLRLEYAVAHPSEMESDVCTLDQLVINLKKLDCPILFENVLNMPPDEFDILYKFVEKALGEQLMGQCFDVAHYAISGFDPIPLLKKYHHRIRLVHLSDYVGNQDRHFPFGMGDCQVDEILQTLEEINYQGFIILEIRPPSHGHLDLYITSYLKILKARASWHWLSVASKYYLFRPWLKKLIPKF